MSRLPVIHQNRHVTRLASEQSKMPPPLLWPCLRYAGLCGQWSRQERSVDRHPSAKPGPDTQCSHRFGPVSQQRHLYLESRVDGWRGLVAEPFPTAPPRTVRAPFSAYRSPENSLSRSGKGRISRPVPFQKLFPCSPSPCLRHCASAVEYYENSVPVVHT